MATNRPTVSKNCKAVREQVDALVEKSGQVRWLGITSGLWTTRHELIDYTKQYKPKIPFTFDESGELFRSFRVRNVPTLVIADSNGQIVQWIEGFDPHLFNKIQGIGGK